MPKGMGVRVPLPAPFCFARNAKHSSYAETNVLFAEAMQKLEAEVKANINPNYVMYWLPAAIWAVLIYYLSSMSSFPETSFKFMNMDKIAHLFEYVIFGFLVNFGFLHSGKKEDAGFKTIVFCAFYALTDEAHQAFIPLREASFFDWTFDFAGVIASQSGIVFKMIR